METIVLGTDAAAVAVRVFLQQVGPKGAEIRDSDGLLIGYVLPPEHYLSELEFPKETLVFGSTNRESMERRKGKTTQQLIEILNSIPLPPNPSHP